MSEPLDAAKLETELIAYLRCEVFAPDVALDAESDLVAAGFDSMSLVRMLLFIEQTYSLWIPEGEITNAALINVRSIVATILRIRNEQ